MIDALEKRLIDALKKVDAHGDVAPAHVHDPMTMLLRENAVRADLMRWDDERGRFLLTGTGRRRITAVGALLAQWCRSKSAALLAAVPRTRNPLKE